MNKIIAGVIAALFLASGVAVAADTGPASIVLKAKNGNVTFPHHAHQERLKGDCKLCHGAMTGGKIAGFAETVDKTKAHGLCHTCHKKEGKGPVAKCGECHKKA